MTVARIRVVLPPHLRALAHVGSEIHLEVNGPVTIRSVVDAVEASYPMLRGTIRDHVTQQRRPLVSRSRENVRFRQRVTGQLDA